MKPAQPKPPVVSKKPKTFNKTAQLGQAEQLRKLRPPGTPNMGGETI